MFIHLMSKKFYSMAMSSWMEYTRQDGELAKGMAISYLLGMEHFVPAQRFRKAPTAQRVKSCNAR